MKEFQTKYYGIYVYEESGQYYMSADGAEDSDRLNHYPTEPELADYRELVVDALSC